MTRPDRRLLLLALSLSGLIHATGVRAADDDDALALQAAPEAAPTTSADKTRRLSLEAAVGNISQRYGGPRLDSRRVSIDLVQRIKLSPAWQLALSDRLDDVHPVEAGSRATLNSLREAYASWQDEGGGLLVEAGRINLRNGPAYGFNPTDYFRDGALRSITSVDPMALRENRLGTVMLRAQRLWNGGGLSLALAPKLANGPDNGSFDPDWGATNHQHRALLTWSEKLGERVSGQALLLAAAGQGPQLGVNATALFSDAVVGHAEWSLGRDDGSAARAAGYAPSSSRRSKLATGATWTLPTGLALTLEYQYNGAALRHAQLATGSADDVNRIGSYLLANQAHQDSAARQAWLLYASQRNAGLKNLDLSGFVRRNSDDRSLQAWLEARYHFERFDLSLQWQATHGSVLSEYGVLPYRQSVQLLGSWYF
ncbi:MAG: hypothetical protein CFE45_00030 [Burkholderiales bacterium PBB5]|nr:MAG: hypothetical protein CFE45_00030 [Burkholderiales bacterium PBB5]